MAVSAAWLLRRSLLFQANHEAAPLWVSSVVLLLSCEASGLPGGPEVGQPWGLLHLRLGCSAPSGLVLSLPLHSAAHAHKEAPFGKGAPLRRSGWVSREKASGVVTTAAWVMIILKLCQISSCTFF
ncbi:hypothetical protein HJG60_010009 [Phyllostomus discolor]|uniref:Uncharacterized protein n=1 Tax=Phyllostomus discolor TaxID=89673 RepID=A0A833YEE4_9CHIR|nr:hypothetical protein HJG60_010009 [Phyllostomus discolor]